MISSTKRLLNVNAHARVGSKTVRTCLGKWNILSTKSWSSIWVIQQSSTLRKRTNPWIVYRSVQFFVVFICSRYNTNAEIWYNNKIMRFSASLKYVNLHQNCCEGKTKRFYKRADYDWTLQTSVNKGPNFSYKKKITEWNVLGSCYTL